MNSFATWSASAYGLTLFQESPSGVHAGTAVSFRQWGALKGALQLQMFDWYGATS